MCFLVSAKALFSDFLAVVVEADLDDNLSPLAHSFCMHWPWHALRVRGEAKTENTVMWFHWMAEWFAPKFVLVFLVHNFKGLRFIVGIFIVKATIYVKRRKVWIQFGLYRGNTQQCWHACKFLFSYAYVNNQLPIYLSFLLVFFSLQFVLFVASVDCFVYGESFE